MSAQVLFYIWEPFRQSLIRGHLFYVEQARKRLLSQFDDISKEADKAAAEWLEKNNHHFDPDRHDPGEFYEAAHEHSIEFYQMLSDMRNQTRLSVVAGMFHEWDKQLRDWLIKEIQHWHRGEKVHSKIWSVNFGDLADLLESMGWNIRSTTYFNKLDACRLVINVYKHGDGKSLADLKQNYSDYLLDPFGGSGGLFSEKEYLNYTHLTVSDAQFQEFSDAIVAFWQGVPERFFSTQVTSVPDWFEKAFLKDCDDQQKQIKHAT